MIPEPAVVRVERARSRLPLPRRDPVLGIELVEALLIHEAMEGGRSAGLVRSRSGFFIESRVGPAVRHLRDGGVRRRE